VAVAGFAVQLPPGQRLAGSNANRPEGRAIARLVDARDICAAAATTLTEGAATLQ